MNTEATTTEQTPSDSEDAAFAAGFDNTTATPAATQAAGAAELKPEGEQDGGTLPSDQPQGDGTTTSTDSLEQPEAAADPFAGLPPAVRDLLAEIPTLRATAETAVRQAKESAGRVASLQSRLDKLNANPAADQAPAKPRFAKVEALREQGLPEIADALEEIAAATTTAEKTRAPDSTADPAGAAETTPVDDSLTPDEMALQIARPTWATDLTGTDFQLWLARQPREYQQRIQSTDKAAEIMEALTQFDAFKKAPPSGSQRGARMAAAVQPTSDGRRGTPRGQVQPMTEDEAFEAGFKSG